jgi:hypothetical protein
MRSVKQLLVALLGATALVGECGCGGLGGSDCGWTTSSVTVQIPVDLVASDAATTAKLCVVGGQCQIQPLVTPSWAHETTATATPSTARLRQLPETGVTFTDVLPASVTRQGSDGPPVQLIMTLYASDKLVLTAEAILGPVNVVAGRPGTCHAKGYWVAAELHTDGTLGDQQFA